MLRLRVGEALLALMLAIPSGEAVYGQSSRYGLTAALGIGPTTGDDRIYEGSFSGSLRLAVSARLVSRLTLVGALQAVGALGANSNHDVSAPTIRTPASYGLLGVSLGLSFEVLSRLYAAGGGGVYRVAAAEFAGQSTPNATAMGFHFGIEAAVKKWSRSSLLLGARMVMIPKAMDQQLLFLPVELSIRL